MQLYAIGSCSGISKSAQMFLCSEGKAFLNIFPIQEATPSILSDHADRALLLSWPDHEGMPPNNICIDIHCLLCLQAPLFSWKEWPNGSTEIDGWEGQFH